MNFFFFESREPTPSSCDAVLLLEIFLIWFLDLLDFFWEIFELPWFESLKFEEFLLVIDSFSWKCLSTSLKNVFICELILTEKDFLWDNLSFFCWIWRSLSEFALIGCSGSFLLFLFFKKFLFDFFCWLKLKLYSKSFEEFSIFWDLCWSFVIWSSFLWSRICS